MVDSIFFFPLDLAIVNSYVIAKSFDSNLSHLQFRINLVTSIFADPVSPTPNKKRKPSDSPKIRSANDLPKSRLLGHHFPVMVDLRLRCKVCTMKSSRSETCFQQCGVHLCIKRDSDCWNFWHSAY